MEHVVHILRPIVIVLVSLYLLCSVFELLGNLIDSGEERGCSSVWEQPRLPHSVSSLVPIAKSLDIQRDVAMYLGSPI